MKPITLMMLMLSAMFIISARQSFAQG